MTLGTHIFPLHLFSRDIHRLDGVLVILAVDEDCSRQIHCGYGMRQCRSIEELGVQSR